MHKQNRLSQETSLYLQQHASNPVDWYPWGQEALEKAKQENKPILLSIGYSACHWCHVMAHESFADPETAEIANKLFINIKVDREERPDLDKIYQTAHQLLTGRGGGWPLNVFLTPENQMPFFAGTYFPKELRYGMPSFKDLLMQIAQYFYANSTLITEQNARLTVALQQLNSPKVVSSNVVLDKKPIEQAATELLTQIDTAHGGFGDAPKFPNTLNIERLLVHEEVVNVTLTKMAQGGIYDQIGGGFFRYSVDVAWQIPHFEKMLYDNAQLLTCYAKANKILNNPLFDRVIAETADWALREMLAPGGGFYATLDADSEHVEGKFYYWDREQIKNLLTADEYKVAADYFGLDGSPNFEEYWHLHVAQTVDKAASNILQSVRQKLFLAREQRIRPGRDEKILTAWNSLMIKGLVLAGATLGREDLIHAAQQTVDFIHNKLWINNRLHVYYQNGRAHLMAYLDDYAFLLDALIALLPIQQRKQDLDFAIELAETLLNCFFDDKAGGFFFTAHDHEPLIYRPKPLMDEAIPTGNGVAAQALAHLGHLLNESRYLEACEKCLKMAWPTITTYPAAYNSLLNALEVYLTIQEKN
jgi:uncharacterized protein YyaL (SSP411 family)